MIKKALSILLIVFSSQVIVSCWPKCDDQGTYENQYKGVTIVPYDLSGFNTKPIVDSVYKNAFGLSVLVNFESTQIARFKQKIFNPFSSALAMKECPGSEYKYPDPIKNVELYATDIHSGVKTNVSAYFAVYGYGEEMMTLEEFFIIRAEWHDGFQFELVNFDSIPNSAIFAAEAYLESGTVFISETEQINFYH